MKLAKSSCDISAGACALRYRTMPYTANLEQLNFFFASLDNSAILGGSTIDSDDNRFSYYASGPVEIFKFAAGETMLKEKLDALLSKYKLENTIGSAEYSPSPDKFRDGLPRGMFIGGWIGHFSYDLCRYFESIPQLSQDDVGLPLIRLCFYDRVIAFDRIEQCLYLIALSLHGEDDVNGKLDGLEAMVKQSANVKLPSLGDADIENVQFESIESNLSKDQYCTALAKVKEHIYAGDVYQINYSQRYSCKFKASAGSLFVWQNRFNPSPYSAYINAGSWQVVCASPELFLEIAGDRVKTCPIKGTRPRLRGSGPDIEKCNQQNFLELLHSDKEQAELNMIIDLERNDIARISKPGTREMTQPRHIRQYASVFHAMATIEGKLKNDLGFYEVLAGTFPGGSITGAPKIRAMEIIDQLEPTSRGIYTGSIGYIGLDGSVCLNIVIRTVIIKDAKAFVQTGGGIVADSSALSEWRETLTKARALLAGISAVSGACNLEKV